MDASTTPSGREKALKVCLGYLQWQDAGSPYKEKIIQGKLLIQNESSHDATRIAVRLEPARFCTLLSQDTYYIARLKPAECFDLDFRIGAMQPSFSLTANVAHQANGKSVEIARAIEIPGTSQVNADRNLIFISYCSADIIRVQYIVNQLKLQRFLVWMAPFEIVPGDWFPELIRSALHHSKAVVIFLSSASIASPWVKDEVVLACGSQADKMLPAIIPIIIESCSIPEILTSFDTIDYASSPEQALSKLFDRLHALLGA